MTDYKDIKGLSLENIVDTGTEGTKVATGTTAQRGSTTGQLRFNSTTGLAEYYTGTAFKEISSPPTITSIDDGDIDSAAEGNQTIVITGSNFSTNPIVLLVANSGSDITPSTVTRNSATQITIVHAKSGFVNANEPYDVKVTNSSNLSAILADAITVDNAPVWQTTAGALTGSPFNDDGTAVSVTLSATDVDTDTVTYAVQSGALPSGITLNTSSGVISGNTPDESSDVTYNFTIRATANSKTTDRAFSMVVQDITPPVWTTAAGSLGSVFDSVRGTASFTVVADADGDTITYSVQSGSLPAGSSLNSSTGVINTFNAVGSNTTSTFTLRASATGGTVDREFTITVKAPVSTTYSYTGSEQTWTIPSGLTAFVVDIKGASANKTGNAGNGGSGGRTQGTRLASAAQVYKIIVGQGGQSGGAYGGGGTGGGSNGGGGGGYSGIFLTSTSHGNSVAIAGGGGGGAWGGCTGGHGGGSSGGNGGNGGGGGGTQSAGGAGTTGGSAGSTLTGGNCQHNHVNGGGGGGGYYGGGAGGQGSTDRGGGGGSGYTGGLESGSSTTTGGGPSGGSNGEIIISY